MTFCFEPCKKGIVLEHTSSPLWFARKRLNRCQCSTADCFNPEEIGSMEAGAFDGAIRAVMVCSNYQGRLEVFDEMVGN